MITLVRMTKTYLQCFVSQANVHRAAALLLCASLPLFAATVYAQDADTQSKPAEETIATPALDTAVATVEKITADLLELITEAQKYADEDEERFFQELGSLLEAHIDFKNFSRAVMGRYAGRKALAEKSDAEKALLMEQIARFNVVFKEALINTYGKGLLVFDGERIEVIKPGSSAEEKAQSGKATIKQLIYGEREKPFEIFYSLRRNDDSDWKIRNMIVEASNLGKIYRNQFYNAYKVYEGDIDKIIENWAGADG